jgi:small-conductance mechanosensitive channel
MDVAPVERRMEWLGINWVGLTAENLSKVRVTFLLVVVVLVFTVVLRRLLRATAHDRFSTATFWMRQGIAIVSSGVLILGLLSIWLDRPQSLTAFLGMITAGLAFALQRVITSAAGYFIILRGKNFTVGDRISLSGVRGDVVDVGFFQTTIMEMGQPKDAGDSTWVRGRQFTGRIVTVANSMIFETPIFNYTKDFPLMWEEIPIPLPLDADRDAVEQAALAAARSHAEPTRMLDATTLQRIRDSYDVSQEALEPQVYFTLHAGGLEATLRFVVLAHNDREAKDAVTRALLEGLRDREVKLRA